MDLEFIQDFIKTAFSPHPKDNGEEGIVWDFWQLNLDYIDLLATYANNDRVENKLRPHLGGWWSRKADVVDTAVWLAFLRCCQFSHLEVCAKGIGNVSALVPPDRFDCSKAAPGILAGIGDTDFFGFYGDKFAAARGGGPGAFARGSGAWRRWRDGDRAGHPLVQNFCQTKTSALHSLCDQRPGRRASV